MRERPQYPDIEARTASANPYALVAAVRQALRRAHVAPREIDRFTREALAREDPDARRRVCRDWVRIDR